MSTTLIVILTAAALALLTVLLNLAGRPRRMRLDDDAARRAWADSHPGDAIRQVTLSTDRRAALLLTDQGPVLVWAAGREIVARRLRDFDLVDEGRAIRVIFRDYATPAAELRLDAFERQHWLNLMDRS
ncbi:hypothetical protein [Pseudodonghicola flavimaris]|uniref:Uncharacterized protein n=1 Tax=Pseudodonghicola flavimaris TaxID=3050036 RepID=A0ABT7EX85_9RHOB|nr:hypothetical protein [Pseudodonghicola flavimaris]MDK3016960.1 hypothetical protein [Pseudodonghicola flavimaris]